ncbi:hypothetical protein J4E08_17570 [Sagittula sp. NFXS13]|uniref:ATP-binding protein n=1 Tax=Sagittula sp. NFXS13 TaxID=2819095 RepID=UPI0032DE8EA5
MTRILIVDTDTSRGEETAALVSEALPDGLKISLATDAESCINLLDGPLLVDCILMDEQLVGTSQDGLLEDCLKKDPFLAIIVTGAGGCEDSAVDAMKRGAYDVYPWHKFTPVGLGRAIKNALSRAAMARQIEDQQNSLRTFAHVLVHDLRAPLRSVRGGVDMLLEDLPPDAQATHAETLGFIRNGAEHIDRLLVNLHRHCNVSDAPLERKDVPLSDIVTQVKDALRQDLMEREAELVVRGTLPEVRGDPVQLTQLLQNLVGNGLKFNKSEAPRVEVSAKDHAEMWCIEISDNGIGIEPSYINEIFEPFRRLHTQTAFAGTGLGLATCRRIALRHGGSLSCSSEVGVGSTFVLNLPKPVGYSAGDGGGMVVNDAVAANAVR